MTLQLICIVGPTASGKSSRAVEEALRRNGPNGAPFGGEIISVDSRQVYRELDIGTEKLPSAERRGIPHHLIDIRAPQENYSAGNFVTDATRLIEDISARGKLPILVGGTHYYFDALINKLPTDIAPNYRLRKELEKVPTEELFERIREQDPRRAGELDPQNRRRLIRALEIIASLGSVPLRYPKDDAIATSCGYRVEWVVLNPSREELRQRIDMRLQNAFTNGLLDEVGRVREKVGDARLNEFGLEYKIVGEFLRGERSEASLLPALSAKLWQYARRQKAWLRKLGLGANRGQTRRQQENRQSNLA